MPNGWVLPSTGMVATECSGVSSLNSMPMRSASAPRPNASAVDSSMVPTRLTS
jgi:hypothetical protein